MGKLTAKGVEALKNLCADIAIVAGEEPIVLKGTTLTRNLAPTLVISGDAFWPAD